MNIKQAVELLKAFDKYPQRIPAPQPGFVYELTPTPDWAIFQAEMLLRELSQNEEVMEMVVDFVNMEIGIDGKWVVMNGDEYDLMEVTEQDANGEWQREKLGTKTPTELIQEALSAGMTCKQIMGEG